MTHHSFFLSLSRAQKNPHSLPIKTLYMGMIRQQAGYRCGEGEPLLQIYPSEAKERTSFVGH
jgi:hypothetical protein